MKPKFSRIIQGCMGWGSWGKDLSKKEMIELLHHSLDCGVTTFDHADIYGDYSTESAFGDAFLESGIKREALQLISKCGIQYVGAARNNTIKHYQYDADYIIWSAETSIQKLNASYLDLFLLHRPSPLMQVDEIAKAIDTLLTSGKIKSFGVSNFLIPEIDLLKTKTPLEVNQIEFSITAFEALQNGVLSHMMQHDITPMSWSPLGAFFTEETKQTERIKSVLKKLSEKYGASHDQLLLSWILKHPAHIHPVIGTTTPNRISAAAAANKIDLTTPEWFELLVSSQGHKVP